MADACEVLILDEVDCLLDGGFQLDMAAIIAELPSTSRQTACFSATVPKKLASVLGIALNTDHVTVDCVGEVLLLLVASNQLKQLLIGTNYLHVLNIINEYYRNRD